jgi:Xaa-Pro aminopeptidase
MTKINEYLIKNNYDYFLLPNTDEFFCEYLHQSEQRISFISGFTGSNATIIFGKEKNYFFTDGRYILQAHQQLDESFFEIIDLAKKSIIQWMKENISEHESLAIDPNLISKNFFKKISENVKKIIYLTTNPVDEIWNLENRNSRDFSLPYQLSEKVAGKSSQQKIAEILPKISADAMLISSPLNLNWLLNIRGNDLPNTPLFLCRGLLFNNGKLIIFANKNLENSEYEILPLKNFQQYFNQNVENISSLQLDFNHNNLATTLIFDKLNINYFHQDCVIENLKCLKNSVEIYGARQAHIYDGCAVIKFLYWLENSWQNDIEIDEISAQEKLFSFRKNNNHFIENSFETISAFAENGAIIHYKSQESTNKKFCKNNLYLIDSGGQYCGEDFMATTDITRTIVIGEPSLEMIENYTLVLKGHINLARVKFPKGSTGSQLDALARVHLWNCKKDYQHGTGHGVGSFLSVHEGPCGISRHNHYPLAKNMILSNEPGIYLENNYGIRLENLMLIDEFDDNFLYFETLTMVPFELNLIDFRMITYPEKKWLTNYHLSIFEKIKYLLNDRENQWFIYKYISPFQS